jgi:hypothetical protein
MITTSSPEPRYAAFIDRDEAKAKGITCRRCRDTRDDKQFTRLRYTKPHVRLYAPRALAQIESDVRDERYSLDAA